MPVVGVGGLDESVIAIYRTVFVYEVSLSVPEVIVVNFIVSGLPEVAVDFILVLSTLIVGTDGNEFTFVVAYAELIPELYPLTVPFVSTLK